MDVLAPCASSDVVANDFAVEMHSVNALIDKVTRDIARSVNSTFYSGRASWCALNTVRNNEAT
jgi:hypothetical protein